jgi:carbon storage regulator CsrA
MLVLTRRETEKILLPDLGVTVELMSVSGNRARLGISAPKSVRILREEVAANGRLSTDEKARSFSHDMRNRLNGANIALEMLRLHLEAGNLTNAMAPLDMVADELNKLKALLVEVESAALAAKVSAKARRPWRALLVEDNANESNLLAGYLRMTGFEVDTAGDGADALDYLHSHDRPDVVLLDMLMPRCDGPTTIGRIRRDPHLDGMKIYAVSGTSQKRFDVQTGPGGVDRWFTKPVDPRELVRQIDSELAALHTSG